MDFPPETARQASLGYAPATIVRHEETGLGDWLVIVPSDFARPLYEALRELARRSAPSISGSAPGTRCGLSMEPRS